MDSQSTAGVLLIAGSLVFHVGAAVGVPRVFTERDVDVRLRMLERNRTVWRVGQPLYALGPVIAAVGVGVLASDGGAPAPFGTACAALVAGALAWCRSTYQRAVRTGDLARGQLPSGRSSAMSR